MEVVHGGRLVAVARARKVSLHLARGDGGHVEGAVCEATGDNFVVPGERDKAGPGEGLEHGGGGGALVARALHELARVGECHEVPHLLLAPLQRNDDGGGLRHRDDVSVVATLLEHLGVDEEHLRGAR